MTRAEAFDKAWRLGIKGDFSLVDEIYHSDYKALDAYSEVEVNLEADKEVASTLGDFLTGTHPVVLSEDENFLRAHGKVGAMRDSIERSGEGEDKSDGGR